MKGNTPGTFAFLRFSLTRRVCELFFLAKNRGKIRIFYRLFVSVSCGFEMTKPSRPKATVHRSSCASTTFLQRPYPRGYDEGPRPQLPHRRPSQLSTSAGADRRLPTREHTYFLRAHSGHTQWPTVHIALCSVSINSSYLKTADPIKLIDETI